MLGLIGAGLGLGMLAKGAFGGGPSASTKRKRMKEEFDFAKENLSYKPKAGAFEYGPEAKADFTRINSGLGDEMRGEQKSLIEALKSRVSGNAPSVAEQQLRSGLEGIQSNINSSIASNRGVNPAMAARSAALAIANAGGDVNRQASVLRADEQTRAEQLLGSVLQGARGADETRSVNEAQLEQQTRLANLQALMEALAKRQAGKMTLEQLKMADSDAIRQMLMLGRREKDARDQSFNEKLIGGGLSAIGSSLGLGIK